MSQTAKQCMKVGAIVLVVVLLFALLLSPWSKSPSQAVHLEPIASSSSVSDGIFPESGTHHGAVIYLEQVVTFECTICKKLSVIKVYQHFHNEHFYQNWADFIHNHGAIEFLSFDPTIETGDLNCCEVLSGDYDSTITTFAREIKSWGQPLILSFAGEMNGNWAGWSGAKNFGPNCEYTYTETTDLYTSYGCTNTSQIKCADGPERYRDMYTHVYHIFASEGVTNVTWAWVVNHESIPDEKWNQIDSSYPGDSYVDIISIDGYNWGDNGPGGWKTFNQVFSAMLTFLNNTYPTKPLMLGEFASAEGIEPMGKADWITEAYSRIKSDWPQIKAALWFNFPGSEGFPVESSSESIRAYRKAIADPYFIGGPECCVYLPVILKEHY